MSEINSSNFKKEHGDLAPDLVGVTELTSPYFFVPPSGDTKERPENCEPGTLRFNTDIGSLEVFRGKTIGWEQILRKESQYLGGGTGSNTGTGTRGITGGGSTPSDRSDVIDFITISTLGNAQDFGNLITAANRPGGLANSTRGIIAGGLLYNPPSPATFDDIGFVTISSTGNTSTFGDLNYQKYEGGAGSSATRGLIMAGYGPNYTSLIEFITIATTGNAIEFGSLSNLNGNGKYSASSKTRAVIGGGYSYPQADYSNTIEFVNIATTGDGTDFGDFINFGRRANTFNNSCNGHGGL